MQSLDQLQVAQTTIRAQKSLPSRSNRTWFRKAKRNKVQILQSIKSTQRVRKCAFDKLK